LSAPATPAVALLCGLVFLFKPAQMFDANGPFFYFGFAQIALLLVPLFLVAFGAITWLASRGAARWQHAIAAALGGIALAAWISATFVASPGGALDGRTLLVPLDEKRDALNALLCAGIALGGAAIAGWRPVLARRFLAALFLALAAQAVWIAASAEHAWRPQGDTRRLTALSAEKNVLVILLDAFQSDFFAEIVSGEPDLARIFEGFTYFANAVGPAPTTYLSLPVIHSGVAYREGERLRDTYRGSVGERSFMARLARRGYDAMLVNAILNYCPEGVLCDHEGPLVRGRLTTLAEAAAFLIDLAVFRIVPDAVKPLVYAEGSWMTTRWVAEDRVATSNRVLELMARSMHVGSPRPVARFLHLFGTHAPARVDAACRPVQNRPWTRETAIAQDRCALSKLSAVLRALQDLGIYDRTAIAVLADHGSGLPKDGNPRWTWGAAASALLLVKPFDARGPLEHSARVVGLGDLAASLCAWTGDCRMESGFDLMRDAEQPPNYPFLAYFWRHEYWLAEAVPIFERYEVRGPPRDIASWRRLARAKNGSP
jgi:hypothetical protein